MTDAVVDRLDELIRATRGAGRERWLDIAGVADLLNFSTEHTRQRIVCLPDFPRPSRIGAGHPRWQESEVNEWMRAQAR